MSIENRIGDGKPGWAERDPFRCHWEALMMQQPVRSVFDAAPVTRMLLETQRFIYLPRWRCRVSGPSPGSRR